jgi:23S rRNA (cytidine1920-2'-O)/16S rRNA (cytidine1409-2'-O)-methyltransferase
MRADLLLVERGFAPSRTAAQRLIAGGHVFARAGESRIALAKASVDLAVDADLEIEVNALDRYVSRGGLKLEGALNHVALQVDGLLCLDVGQSTGGFTDCLLQRGADHVVGVDVGHDQLHATLRNNPRVTCIEGVNARELNAETVGAALLRSTSAASRRLNTSGAESRHNRCYDLFDVIVADVSFISLTKVLPQWPTLLGKAGRILSLVKPQFEVGADNLARGGIVRDEALFLTVESTIRESCNANGLHVLDYFASSITGTDGNREFFVYAEAMP